MLAGTKAIKSPQRAQRDKARCDRRTGAGRKKLAQRDPGEREALDSLVEPSPRGDRHSHRRRGKVVRIRLRTVTAHTAKHFDASRAAAKSLRIRGLGCGGHYQSERAVGGGERRIGGVTIIDGPTTLAGGYSAAASWAVRIDASGCGAVAVHLSTSLFQSHSGGNKWQRNCERPLYSSAAIRRANGRSWPLCRAKHNGHYA